MKQTKLESLQEVLVGSTLTIATALIFNVTLLPWLLGVPISFIMGLKVTALYQVASVIIRFGVRRYNNARVRHTMRSMRSGRGSIQSIPGRVSMPDMRITDRNADASNAPSDEGDRPVQTEGRGHDQANKELRQ